MIPFGWSVGDIAFAIGFIAKIIKALKDHGGAVEDYQAKARFLEGVEATLRDLEFFARHFAGSAYIDAISDNAAAVHRAVDVFISRLQSYEASIGVNRQTKAFLRPKYHKVKWALYTSDRCAELQSTIQLPLTAINTHLNMQIL